MTFEKKDLKMLFLTQILEHPPAGGPYLRIENSIKALADMCDLHIISLVAFDRIGGKVAEDFYRQYCSALFYAPSVNPGFKTNVFTKIWRRLQCLTTQFTHGKKRAVQQYEILADADYVIDYMLQAKIDVLWFGYGCDGVRGFPMAQRIKQRAPHIKIIFDTASVQSITLSRGLPYAITPEYKQRMLDEIVYKRRDEALWVNLCETTIAVSEIDATYYRSLTKNPEKIKIFSNVLDKDMYAKRDVYDLVLQQPAFFLAGYFGPNSPMQCAALWFIDSILPLVLKEFPTAHLYIIGKGSDTTFKDFKHPAVSVTGTVDSVLPYLFQARVALAPLKSEGGPHIKVLEAGIAGIPIVCTTLGAEGLDVVDGKDLLIADEPEQFAQAIIKILRDDVFATMLVNNCKKLVEEEYTLERLKREATDIIKFVQQG